MLSQLKERSSHERWSQRYARAVTRMRDAGIPSARRPGVRRARIHRTARALGAGDRGCRRLARLAHERSGYGRLQRALAVARGCYQITTFLPPLLTIASPSLQPNALLKASILEGVALARTPSGECGS